MAVKIRLKKMGTLKKPHYKIVVMDWAKGRNSKAIEELGYYDPSKNPPFLKINRERADYWIKVGAQTSETIRSILKKAQ